MRKYKYIIGLAILITLINCAFPKDAYAYLDPGTGSFFFQLIIAAILGGLFALKLFWKRIKSALIYFFSRIKRKKRDGN